MSGRGVGPWPSTGLKVGPGAPVKEVLSLWKYMWFLGKSRLFS